jgi:PHP family Zn ribbon phosphoesterase
MNWQLEELQHISITSHSDAHSLQKLAREATLLNCDLSFNEIINSIKTNDRRMVGTIEFFPQEGKYHYNGHRKCNICYSPTESEKHGNICPICKRPLTIGVLQRVNDISTIKKPASKKTIDYCIPLTEIIAETKGKGVKTKTVEELYWSMIKDLGNEFSILRSLPISYIKQAGFREIADAISQVRRREVTIIPGYDGVYGKISLQKKTKQLSFF